MNTLQPVRTMYCYSEYVCNQKYLFDILHRYCHNISQKYLGFWERNIGIDDLQHIKKDSLNDNPIMYTLWFYDNIIEYNQPEYNIKKVSMFQVLYGMIYSGHKIVI